MSSFINELGDQIAILETTPQDVLVVEGQGPPGPPGHGPVITVGTTPPSSPQIGDLWVDTN